MRLAADEAATPGAEDGGTISVATTLPDPPVEPPPNAPEEDVVSGAEDTVAFSTRTTPTPSLTSTTWTLSLIHI